MITYITHLILAMGVVISVQLAADEPKPYLYSTKGIYTHPISTKNALAQQYFDLGMLFYYGYIFEEAERSFQQAAKLDPDCAICYWGMALASRDMIGSIQDQPTLVENVRKAQQLMAKASPQEQAYIQALVNSYIPTSVSFDELDSAFSREMKKVSEQYPKDADAAALYAKADLNISEDGKDVQQSIKKLLVLYPDHPGLNHYYIHALDATSEPNEGLASAKSLENKVPFIGHLLHMPAHIYYKVGDFPEATKTTEKAMQADENFFSKGGLKGNYYSGFYLHNYQFNIASLVMEGKEKKALESIQKLNNILETGKPNLSLYMKNALAIQKLLVLQRFNNWEQILKEPKPETPVGNGMWHFSRSLAFLAQNDLAQAKSEASAIENEQVDKSEDSLNTLLKVMSLHAQAAIAEKEGHQDQMVADYQQAIKLEEEIAWYEPPLWFTSAREALGFALLRAGNRAEAAKLFTQDLKLHPNKPWSLDGLKKSQ